MLLLLGRIWYKRRQKADQHKRRQDAITATVLAAQENNELFDVQFLDKDSAIYSVSGILLDIDDTRLRLEVLHHLPSDLNNTDVDVYFRVPLPSGYSFYKFRTRLLDIDERQSRTTLLLSSPGSLDVGQPRKFLRITPPADAIAKICIWHMHDRPMPESAGKLGAPGLIYRADTEEPMLQVENISATGMALSYPVAAVEQLPMEVKEGDLLLCLLVYTMQGQTETKRVDFWSVCKVNKIRVPKAEPPYLVMGLQFTHWAVQEPGCSELAWFSTSTGVGATPIIQWVTQMDLAQYRYYWGNFEPREARLKNEKPAA
ncbi:MAG: hypothetical protein Q4F27_00185 [Desulfovibrionaceae bacterium]|nr:hypothetical protein [Desulfovibrionaceae bacterium]